MLNIIFSFMIILSVLYAVSTGNADKVTETAIISVKDTLSLTVTILSSMCVFNSMMRVLNKAGITDKLSRALKKPLGILFNKKEDEDAFGVMSMNIAANILGLGNAATPFGLKTMEKLKKNHIRATNSMCLFAVMNTASLQLIPSTILALRISANSLNPYIIIIPVWICSLTGLITGITLSKIYERRN